MNKATRNKLLRAGKYMSEAVATLRGIDEGELRELEIHGDVMRINLNLDGGKWFVEEAVKTRYTPPPNECPDCEGTGDVGRNAHPRQWDDCPSCGGSGTKTEREGTTP